MTKTLIAIDKVASKEFRIVRYDSIVYHDEINGETNTDPKPETKDIIIQLQIRRRFLWIKYWSIIKTYECGTDEKTARIQIANARRKLNKLTEELRYGKLS